MLLTYILAFDVLRICRTTFDLPYPAHQLDKRLSCYPFYQPIKTTRMEAKLKEYRELRRRKELNDNAETKLEEPKEKVKKFSFLNLFNMNQQKQEDEILLMEEEEVPTPNRILIQPEENEDVNSEVSEAESLSIKAKESWRYFMIKWSVYFIIWLTLYIMFLRIQFGAVFFVLSALIGIYFNTRTRPRRKGEVSAYSVFNENCTSIEGTLKPEQFEREIRYGPGTVR